MAVNKAKSADILVLDPENIQESINSHEYILILYYDSFSPQSKIVVDNIATLAQHLSKINSLINVAIFDDKIGFLQKYVRRKIPHYPSLLIHFESGKWINYEGGKNYNFKHIALWLEENFTHDVIYGRGIEENSEISSNVPVHALVGLGLCLFFIFI
uniref:Thioredoxin domain-containing protein n=1 Tax=Ditylenchus dipsaci TaxID=166011 RepID=A0A915ESE3_9BILA